MAAYDLPNRSNVCAKSGRELLPGEPFVSVLTVELGKYRRDDYAGDSWPGPPKNYLAHWRGRIPATSREKKPKMEEGVLFALFDQLAGADEPAKRNFRYVLALLLLRRKKLKLEDTAEIDGVSSLILTDTRTGQRTAVIDPELSESEIEEAQMSVFAALGW